MRQKSGRKGLLGSAVVGKHVTDFLDLNQVIHARQGEVVPSRRRGRQRQAGPGGRSLGILARPDPEQPGHGRLPGAGGRQSAMGDSRAGQQPVDVVVAALDLPPDGCSALFDVLRRRPEWQGIPGPGAGRFCRAGRGREKARPADCQDCQVKFDHEAMLESVARLASALVAAEPAPVGAGEER